MDEGEFIEFRRLFDCLASAEIFHCYEIDTILNLFTISTYLYLQLLTSKKTEPLGEGEKIKCLSAFSH